MRDPVQNRVRGSLAAANEQSSLGQSVAWIKRFAAKTAWAKRLGKSVECARVDWLGTIESNFPRR